MERQLVPSLGMKGSEPSNASGQLSRPGAPRNGSACKNMYEFDSRPTGPYDTQYPYHVLY